MRGAEGGPARPPLPVDRLQRELLRPGGWWTGLTVVAETGSTNTDLAAAARSGAAEGRVLVAEHQRAGRGRAGRGWSSPPRAGLAVSVLLRPGAAGVWPPVPPTHWGWLTMLAGVALAETVTELAGLPATLKWPNDLRVAGGKCAGILAEVAGDAVVLGIGLNVTLRADELPPPPPEPDHAPVEVPPATSLQLAGAATVDRAALLVDLLHRLGQWYDRWRRVAGDADACGLRPAYLRYCDTLGQAVRVRVPGGAALTGVVDTVDRAGHLVLLTDAGPRVVPAGDVRQLRGLATADRTSGGV